MSPVQMTTLELARECRKFVDHIENKPLPCNDTTGLPKELAATQAELLETKNKLQRLQQTYEERCEAFTQNEKQLQR